MSKALDEHGRKYSLAIMAVRAFAAVFVSAFVKSLVPALEDLDLEILMAAAGGIAGIAGLYAGANAWKAQADAKIAEHTGKTPEERLAEEEV